MVLMIPWLQVRILPGPPCLRPAMSGAPRRPTLGEARSQEGHGATRSWKGPSGPFRASWGPVQLASDIPPFREILSDNGRCFVAGDVGPSGAALTTALSDPALKGRAEAVRTGVVAEYDWDRIAETIATLYREIAHVRLG